LTPFRALREADRRRRDEERLSAPNKELALNQKQLLDRKSPIQVRIHLSPAESPCLTRPGRCRSRTTPFARVCASRAKPVSRMFGNWLFRRMYWGQVGRFIRDADVRREFVPLLYQQFDATPSARPAFFRLNEDLLPMVRSRTRMIPKLKEFRRPVRIIFGDADPSLNSGVARTRVPSRLRTIPDSGCSTLRPTGRAGAGGAVNPGHARVGSTPT